MEPHGTIAWWEGEKLNVYDATQYISTTFEDTSEIPYGLGCGGTIDLLLEPSGTPEFAALVEALEGSLNGTPAMAITLCRVRTHL